MQNAKCKMTLLPGAAWNSAFRHFSFLILHYPQRNEISRNRKPGGGRRGFRAFRGCRSAKNALAGFFSSFLSRQRFYF